MLYLLAATFGSAFLVIILKIVKMRGLDATAAIAVNYLVGAAITLPMAGATARWGHVVAAPWFAMSLVVGVLFMVSLVVYAVSADRSGVAVTTISGRAAMAVPVIFAFVFLGERPTPLKIALLVAIFFAMWLVLKQPKGAAGISVAKKRAAWAAVGLPLLVFLLNGVNDTMMQFTKRVQIIDPGDNMAYTGVMFVASALTGIVFWLIENRGRYALPSGRSIGWGVVLGLTNTVCVLGILFALERMDGSVFYPLYYAGAVVISTVAGVWFFRERLSWVNFLGIAIALASIVLLAAV